MNLPCFIDFEASSLQVDSFPTEVAWSTPEGVIESHLINPYGVEEWTDWDPGAQAITGISRRLLREQGRPPAWVCERMTTSTGSRSGTRSEARRAKRSGPKAKAKGGNQGWFP